MSTRRSAPRGKPDDKTGESNPQPIGICNDAGRQEDQSGQGQPQLKWTAGAGRGAVTIEKYAKSADRLKPILLQGLERVDALDAFAAVQKVFGMISLDYRTFRDMLNQYGEIVMYVPGPQLALLTDGEKTGNLRVSSARDPHGYSDQVEVRELTILNAMKRVGTHIPIPPPTKMESTPYRSTGILMSGQCPRVALCAAPPFCPGNAFVSLWGPGLQCEFGGAVLLPPEVPEIDAEFCEIFAKHSIWSLVSVFGSGGSTQGTAEPESDAQWESARQQVEIFVKQSCGLASDAPSWVCSSIAKSKCVSGAQKNRGSLKSGNYVPTSSILPNLPSGWGSLTAIGEPCHTAEITQRISRTVQVSSGSQSSAAVVEVIGPQWSRICDPWRKNGLPAISLVGCSSVLIDVSEECTSVVYAQGSSKFHLEFSPAVLGSLGIVHWPVSVGMEQQDDTLPLWSALHALIQGVNAQVLQRNGRLIARRRSPVPIQLDAWGSTMCSVTKFDSSWKLFCSQVARCVIRNSEHGPFLSLFLNWTPPLWCSQKYQVSAWSNMLVPENLNPVSCEFSMLSINLQGINRSTETPVTKWDQILALQAESMSDMIAPQETYGAPKQCRSRYVDGFLSKRSTVVSVGKGLELWVRGAWASFIAVVLDEYFVLLVLVRSALGLGIAGSLHMAQRSDTAEYHKQLLSLVRVIEESAVIWTALGADWNRDIRSHRQSSVVFEQHQLNVVSMEGSPMQPKDFFVVKGVGLALSGLWLSPIGDHPVVHVSGSVSLQRGATGSAKRPVEAGKSKGAQRKLFTEVFEALSGAIRSPSLWMQAYRECLVVALRPGSQPQVHTSSGRHQLEAILQGQPW